MDMPFSSFGLKWLFLLWEILNNQTQKINIKWEEGKVKSGIKILLFIC